MSDDILSAVQALEGQPGPEDMKEKDSGIATSTNNVIHTNTGPMTLLSVELDAHDDPHQAIIAEALRQQQQGGTQLIVHIEEGSTQNMQVLLDGKLVPVSSISDVIQKDALTTTTPLPRPAPIKMAGIRPVVPIVQKTIEDAGFAAIVGRKRKRHHSLMRDEQTQLSGESFKSQLLDTSDTIKGLDLAPPTKLVMDYTSTIDLDTLFGFPSRPHSSKPILDAFSRNLDVVKLENKCRKRAKLPEPKDADLSLDITSMITNHDFGFQMCLQRGTSHIEWLKFTYRFTIFDLGHSEIQFFGRGEGGPPLLRPYQPTTIVHGVDGWKHHSGMKGDLKSSALA